MKFELHCHTYYSKGKKIPWEATLSPEEVFKLAKKKNFSGVAITDHDTTKGWKESKRAAKKYGVIFIPGVEITTLDGHVLALGINEPLPKELSLEETVELIHQQGGISIAAHPFDIRNEGIKTKIDKVDAVEVFNSLCHDRFSNFLAQRYAEKKKKPMVAGSDAHTKEMFGCSANYIDAQTVDEVLKKIKAGRVRFEGRYPPLRVMTKWFKERLSRSERDVVKYVDKNYFYPKAWISKKLLYRFINSNSDFWYYLTIFGYSMATLYSFLKLLRYYYILL